MSTKTKAPKPEKAPKEPRAPKEPKAGKPGKPGKTDKAAAKQRRNAENAEPAAVNLLSPWVLDELRVLQLRKRFLLGTLALLLVLGLCWAGLRLELRSSEQEVRGEEEVTSSLGAQIATLGKVRTYVNDVEKRSGTVEAVQGGGARFSRALQALADALPRTASLDSLTVKLPVGAAAESGTDNEAMCPGPDPFGTNDVVACMEISGTASSREDVSTFVIRLDRIKLFVEPFVATTTRGTDQDVTFTGSVGVSYSALADPQSAPNEEGTR